jgi:uncharacterized protein YoxC
MLNIIIEENRDKTDRELLHKILETQHFMLGKFVLEFQLLKQKINQLMTTAEFIQAMTDLKGEVTTIGTKVDALEAAINNAGSTVPQGIVDAFNDLKTSVDSLNTKADNTPATPPTV